MLHVSRMYKPESLIFFMTASKLLPEFDDLGTELLGLLRNEHWNTSFALSVVIFITTGVR